MPDIWRGSHISIGLKVLQEVRDSWTERGTNEHFYLWWLSSIKRETTRKIKKETDFFFVSQTLVYHFDRTSNLTSPSVRKLVFVMMEPLVMGSKFPLSHFQTYVSVIQPWIRSCFSGRQCELVGLVDCFKFIGVVKNQTEGMSDVCTKTRSGHVSTPWGYHAHHTSATHSFWPFTFTCTPKQRQNIAPKLRR